MAVPTTPFSSDVLGRYVCNSFQEAQTSGPFDVITVGARPRLATSPRSTRSGASAPASPRYG